MSLDIRSRHRILLVIVFVSTAVLFLLNIFLFVYQRITNILG